MAITVAGKTMRPLAIDLCCGLGGWSEGLLAENWDVVGFDIEQHVYGGSRYPAQLVIQDILTLDGRQFRGKVSLIVASPPCQFFSYTAMPWSRAKKLAAEVRADPVRLAKELALFNACVRIGREAECPTVIENVRGAIPWIGRSRANYGSFHLWQDVPALMPMTKAIKNNGGSWFNIGSPGQKELNRNPVHEFAGQKVPGFRFDGSGKTFQTASVEGTKTVGHVNKRDGHTRHLTNQREHEGIKQRGSGREWFAGEGIIGRTTGSHSKARKAASAAIAKIPLPLARYVARYWMPT